MQGYKQFRCRCSVPGSSPLSNPPLTGGTSLRSEQDSKISSHLWTWGTGLQLKIFQGQLSDCMHRAQGGTHCSHVLHWQAHWEWHNGGSACIQQHQNTDCMTTCGWAGCGPEVRPLAWSTSSLYSSGSTFILGSTNTANTPNTARHIRYHAPSSVGGKCSMCQG